MSNIKFYSEIDMTVDWNIKLIVKKINNKDIEREWHITDLLEFHNMLKFLEIKEFSEQIVLNTKVDMINYKNKVRQRIGSYLALNKDKYLDLFEEISYMYVFDFLEIFENYKLYNYVSEVVFSEFLINEVINIDSILHFKKLTNYFDIAIKDQILSDTRNAASILSNYLGENNLYLPPSLKLTEILTLIDDFINNEPVDINVLRQIINFPSNKALKIPDKIRLHAKRKAEAEEEKIFGENSGLKSEITISYPENQQEAILFKYNMRYTEIKISRMWIKDNLDYPTLWNNFIYLFEFVDNSMRLELVSRKSESSALEIAIRPNAAHLYFESASFFHKEMLSDLEIHSYVNVLNLFGVRFEEMIVWFFKVYLKEEFQINDFHIKMPSSESSFFEKCRTILPEIDRVLKQYNTLIEEGAIDQELIQMSSSSFKIKDVKSFNKKKYLYSSTEWYKSASFLLFSDQSSIFYLPNKNKKYKNFFELILNEKLVKSDFNEYQLNRMQWLFDQGLICENTISHIEFLNWRIIYILKELYYKEVLSYWHLPKDIQSEIEELEGKGLIELESSLFSRNEQNYLDYYLNKSTYTNGHDIRNKYLHGTNTNNETQFEIDYYRILKIFIIIILKINDDVYIKEIIDMKNS